MPVRKNATRWPMRKPHPVRRMRALQGQRSRTKGARQATRARRLMRAYKQGQFEGKNQ